MDKGVVLGILSIKRGVFMDKIPDQAGADGVQSWLALAFRHARPDRASHFRVRSSHHLRSHRQTG